MEYILQTTGLSKKYERCNVVDCVDIHVKPGEIYGFLGRNGAGKTTTIGMIAGLVTPSSGEIFLFGERMHLSKFYQFYDKIGVIIDRPGFYPNLTAEENLEIHRQMMGIPNIEYVEEVLSLTGLIQERKQKLKNFSQGLKQRLAIARALLHRPKLLILDEPTNGLDPIGIKEIRQLLLELVQKREVTIFFSSHILGEVELIANRIGVIHQGRLIEEAKLEDLQQKNRQYIKLKVNNIRKAVLILEQNLGVEDYQVIDNNQLRIYQYLNESAMINKLLLENEIQVLEISLKQNLLEDYFIAITGGDNSA